MSPNISDFLCAKCNPGPLEKSQPLFPSNRHLKVEVLSSPPFFKIWFEVQPSQLPPQQKGSAHYEDKSHSRAV